MPLSSSESITSKTQRPTPQARVILSIVRKSAEFRLEFSEEVAEAIDSQRALVALESTLLAHGLPRPLNLEVAREMEEAVRQEGATPATIAVLDGRACIGLNADQLARVVSGELAKAGVRDLAVHLASHTSAATTVSGTLRLAGMAGIPVMATGGIGGVHREAAESGDVSSDLLELSRSAVAVVCSGAKSILDLPRTLEWLETQGILVVGYRTREFPAFYSRSGGLALEHHVEEPVALARMIGAQRQLGVTGLLVVQPVPETSEISGDRMQDWLDSARQDARRAGVRGKAVTPFLLEKLAVISRGRTLDANRALVVENSRLAARLSCALARAQAH